MCEKRVGRRGLRKTRLEGRNAMRITRLKWAAAAVAVAAMAAEPIAAKKAETLRDLVGASGASAARADG